MGIGENVKMNIELPAIIYLDGMFYIITKDIEDFFTVKDGVLFHAENLVRKQRSGWLLSRVGDFYLLENIGKIREWARKIPFFNLVLSRYKMGEPKKITISQMKEKMQEIPKSAPYNDLKKDFIRHLNSYDDNTILDKKVLDEWPID